MGLQCEAEEESVRDLLPQGALADRPCISALQARPGCVRHPLPPGETLPLQRALAGLAVRGGVTQFVVLCVKSVKCAFYQ